MHLGNPLIALKLQDHLILQNHVGVEPPKFPFDIFTVLQYFIATSKHRYRSHYEKMQLP
jgi:hypothetical protein